MKVSTNEYKIRNQLKFAIRDVKDGDEVEIAVQNPKLAGKKGASGALHVKKNIEKQQKATKNTQSQSQNPTELHQTYL